MNPEDAVALGLWLYTRAKGRIDVEWDRGRTVVYDPADLALIATCPWPNLPPVEAT